MTLLLPLFLAWLGPASVPAAGPAGDHPIRPVTTDAVRLDVRPAGDHSSGIPEWTVE
jgi:hypothetical protein